MTRIIRKHAAESIADGTYLARLEDLTDHKHSQYGDRLRWHFVLVAPDSVASTKVSGFTGTVLGPKTKLRKWIKAFGVRFEDIVTDFDIESFLDKQVMVTVKKIKSGDAVYLNITDLSPLDDTIVPVTEVDDDGNWDEFLDGDNKDVA